MTSKLMQYWKEATDEEYEQATSRVFDYRTDKKYIVIKSGKLVDVIVDLNIESTPEIKIDENGEVKK